MNVLFTGTDANGDQFVSGEATAVGWGAFQGGDGTNGLINYGGGDLKNIPVEVFESRYPIRIHRYALRNDSGGAGQWRGGLGIEREYEVIADDVTVSTWFERTLTPGWGLFGADPGAVTEVTMTYAGQTEDLLKTNRRDAPRGSRIMVATGGGGGYGNPAERDPQLIDSDRIDGYVTA